MPYYTRCGGAQALASIYVCAAVVQWNGPYRSLRDSRKIPSWSLVVGQLPTVDWQTSFNPPKIFLAVGSCLGARSTQVA